MKNDSLGQLILCGVPGKELDAASAEMFRKVQPGGFILFGRNIESAPQLRKLIDDLRDLSRSRADHHDRSGRRPRFAVAIDRQRAAERAAIARQGRSRSYPATRRHYRTFVARFWIQSRSLPRARHFVRRQCRQFAARTLLRQNSRAGRAQRGRVQRRDAQRRGSRAAANISPDTPARNRTRITNCRESIALAKNWMRMNWPCSAHS